MSDNLIRVVVFEEGDRFVAQCLEYDICVQERSIPSLLDRLELTIEAEFATCEAAGNSIGRGLGAAPSHYASLWARRSVQLKRVGSSMVRPDLRPAYDLDIGMIDTARAAA